MFYFSSFQFIIFFIPGKFMSYVLFQLNINCKLSFTTFRIWCHYNWDMINIVFFASLFVSFFSSKLQSSFTNMQKTDVTVVIWHVVFGRSNLYHILGVLFRNMFAHFGQLWLIFNDNFFYKDDSNSLCTHTTNTRLLHFRVTLYV